MPKAKKKRMNLIGKPYSDQDSEPTTEEDIAVPTKINEKFTQHFKNNCFQCSKTMESYTENQVLDYRKTHNISVKGDEIPHPIMKFSHYDFPSYFLKEFKKQKYISPTPIQSQGWPICLSGRDMIGIAQTGSGKTLAYILPAILHIKNQSSANEGEGPIVVVVAPTRELAQQIYEVVEKFYNSTKIKATCIVGGASKGLQYKAWMRGSDICIATPGRLIDILKSTNANLDRCTYLCIDEADRMLDMGFEPQISSIMKEITSERQTVMFSATWPDAVKSLAKEFLRHPVTVKVGSEDLSANRNILQIVDVCRKDQKPDRLLGVLSEIFDNDNRKVIIFVHTRERADQLTEFLKEAGWPVTTIHGDKSQEERNRSLGLFRYNKSRILVATDVAARGLDVDDITFVINYDYPSSTEDYVHRIGRTGRSNKKGNAYTFFTPHDAKHAKDLLNILNETGQVINPHLKNMLTREGRAQFQLQAGGFKTKRRRV